MKGHLGEEYLETLGAKAVLGKTVEDRTAAKLECGKRKGRDESGVVRSLRR